MSEVVSPNVVKKTAKARSKEWREKAKAEGRCLICGNPVDRKGYVTCSVCFSVAKYRREKRMRNGQCVTCGKPLEDGYSFKNCPECLECFRNTMNKRNASKYKTWWIKPYDK